MPGLFHKHGGRWHRLPVAASPSVLWFDPIGIEPGTSLLPGARVCLLVRAAGAQWAALPADGVDLRHNGLPVSAGLRLLDHRDALMLTRTGLADADLADADLADAEVADAEVARTERAFTETGTPTLYFSAEELARVEPFAGDAPVACPRCRSDVRPGDAAVRCPSCGVVHHESTDRNCWTYAPACALCSQPTALDAGYRWTPEEDL